MLDEKNKNYILSIYGDKYNFGLSWADISRGGYYLTEISGKKDLDMVLDLISGIVPKEIVIQDGLDPGIAPFGKRFKPGIPAL